MEKRTLEDSHWQNLFKYVLSLGKALRVLLGILDIYMIYQRISKVFTRLESSENLEILMFLARQ